MSKKRRESKTLWFSFALIALGVLEANMSLLQTMIPEKYWGHCVIGIGIGVGWLRFYTSQALGKEPDDER